MKCHKDIISKLVLIMALSFLNSSAQCEKKTAAKKLPPYLQNPMANPIDNPNLPNVLIIGDSISIGYTLPVRKLLEGKANVFRPEVNCEHSGFGARNIEKWIGNKKWDVIHFNFGIWDTHYMYHGKMVLEKDLPNINIKEVKFRHTTDEYINNLKKILASLKKTGAKLIWTTTTPFTYYDEPTKKLLLKNNEEAVKLMKNENVQIDNLYNCALPNLKKWLSNDGYHFSELGYEQLGKQVASSITSALNSPIPVLKQDYQVIQRDCDSTGNCQVLLDDSSLQSGKIDISIKIAGGKIIYEKSINVDDKIKKNKYVLIQDIPVGGPYKIILSNPKENLKKIYNNILVGDIWILAGQSNMQGVAKPKENYPKSKFVNMLSLVEKWEPATIPLHRMKNTELPVFVDLYRKYITDEEAKSILEITKINNYWGVCSGRFFADELYKKTSVPIGLIPCAWGGTTLQQWNPEQYYKGKPSLYGIMLQKVKEAGGRVHGMLWYQGESDALVADEKIPATYKDRFKKFVSAVHKDIGEIPVITVQLGRTLEASPEIARYWQMIQENQRLVAEESDDVFMVPAFDYDLNDPIHISYQAQKKLAHRLARIALPLVNSGLPSDKGIRLKSVKYKKPNIIAVTYEGVKGKLQSKGRPYGFELRINNGKTPVEKIYRIEFSKDDPQTILLYSLYDFPKNSQLVYGPGANSYVNIVDSDNMSIPVFGPLKIESETHIKKRHGLH